MAPTGNRIQFGVSLATLSGSQVCGAKRVDSGRNPGFCNKTLIEKNAFRGNARSLGRSRFGEGQVMKTVALGFATTNFAGQCKTIKASGAHPAVPSATASARGRRR